MTDAKDQKTAQAPANANPAPAPAPVPTSPSPLQIGTAFIKQYYQVLSTNPTLITRFYKPNSVISHSLVPSAPAEPKTLSELTKVSEGEDDQIFQWCRSKENKNGICFDFGRGAIDAHNTINGGILLVATGHMTLPSDEKEQDGTGMKKFVQTFLLNNGAPVGKKRQFYVHNDVLRVLDAGVEAGKEAEVVAKDEVAASDAPEAEKDAPEAVAVAEEKEAVPVEDAAVESKSDAKDDAKAEESTASKEEVVVEAKVADTPANGQAKATPVVNDGEEKKIDKQAVKEESTKETSNVKSDVEVEKSTAAGSNAKSTKPEEKKSNAKSTSEKKGDSGNQEKKGRKNKSRGRSRKSRSSSPTEGNDGKKSEGVPGSWASLVAGGSGPSAVAAAAASAAAKITKDEKKNAPAADSTTDDSKDSASAASEKRKSESAGKQSKNVSGSTSTDQQQKQQQQQSKKVIAAQRTPEATILIKNIPDRTKEGEIRIMFEPYAAKLQKKILGITLLASRGFCFVDFDSKVVVDEIVKIVEAEKAAAAKDTKNNKEGGNNSFASKLFMINGKPLDVGRKVPDSKAGSGGRGRGFRRSASPGNSRAGGYNKNNRSGGGRKGSPRGGTKPVNKK